MPNILPIKNFPTYYIHPDGYVFREIKNKKVRVAHTYNSKESVVYVVIENQQYNLLNLMLQYFGFSVVPNDRLSYRIINNHIPFSSISVEKFVNKKLKDDEDEALIHRYKCDIKSSSANNRISEDQITPFQILTSLRLSEFKCVYCDTEIDPHTWQLDHVRPISRGGRNIFENVVPSCKTCNSIKGDLHYEELRERIRRMLKSKGMENYMNSTIRKSNYFEPKKTAMKHILGKESVLKLIEETKTS